MAVVDPIKKLEAQAMPVGKAALERGRWQPLLLVVITLAVCAVQPLHYVNSPLR